MQDSGGLISDAFLTGSLQRIFRTLPTLEKRPAPGHFDTTKQVAEKLVLWTENGGNIPSGAEAHVDIAGLMYGLKPVPFTVSTFSASCKVVR